MLTIKDICQRTGLKPYFVRRCIKQLQPLLNPNDDRGDNNEILLESNGFVVFDRIKLLKEQGLKLPSIQRHLEQEFPDIFQRSSAESRPALSTLSNSDHTQFYVEELLKLQQARLDDRDKFVMELQDKDHRIQDLLRKNDALEGQIKMLPGGKSPSEVRQEYDAQVQSTRDAEQRYQELQQETEFQHREQQRNADYRHREQQRLLDDLKTAPFYQRKKRKTLMTRLGELLSPDQPAKSE